MLRALVLGLCAIAFSPVNALGGLVINYTGDPQFEAAFTSAEQVWEGILVGYQDGLAATVIGSSSYSVGETLTDVFVNASVVPIDGQGGILGQAGPDAAIRDTSGFVLATDGTMQFDSADVVNLFNSGRLEATILHEMAHVLGFGTLWTNNGVYVTNSGEYTGANATAAWQTEFGQPGTPDVELDGGPGTANAHWNESNTIFDQQGRPISDELMTGFLSANTYISDMTVASFVDIGFTAVPEPGSIFVLSLFTAACAGRRFRRA